MKKYAKYIVSMSLALPMTSEAVTLGNITVKSYLNQPLDAYIRLIDLGDAELSGIKVRLASPEAFQRAEISRPYNLSKLTFKITKRYGKPIVKVTSIERIDEPFMTFMLDLTWAKGQYYRTYTVLLDPPGYDLALERKPLPILPPKPKLNTKDWHTVTQTTKAPITSDYIKTPLPVNEENLVTGTFGPVKAKDDLWKIAMRYKPDNISVYQVMIALLAFNEDAFSSGNINGLKTGAILDIPSYKVMSLIPAKEAKLEVEAQSRAWKKKETPAHVLSSNYLKRSFYEKSTERLLNAKTSYLPSLQFNKMSPEKKVSPLTPTTQSSLPLSPKKAEDNNSFSSSIKTTSSPKLSNDTTPTPSLTFIKKEAKPKEQIFDSFIPIPQVLTKIVKHPKNGGATSTNNEKPIETSTNNDTTISQKSKNESLTPELAVAASAIATVKESNVLLRDQVKTLLKQNELLKQEALNERQAVQDLKKKIEALTRIMTKHYKLNEKGEFVKRKAVKSTTYVEEESSPIYWVLLSLLAIMILSAGGAYGLFYLARHGLLFNTKSKEDDEDEMLPMRSVEPIKASNTPSPVMEQVDISSESNNVSTQEEKTKTEKKPEEKESTNELKEIKDHQDDKEEKTKKPATEEDEASDEITFEYELSDHGDDIDALHEEEATTEVKATKKEKDKKENESLSDIDSLDNSVSDDNSEEAKDDYVLEFEPGLAPSEEEGITEDQQAITEEAPEVAQEDFIFESDPNLAVSVSSARDKDEAESATSSDKEIVPTSPESDSPLSLEPIDTPSETPTEETPADSPPSPRVDSSPVKASTQLALAETYISMEDYDSAQSALEDVLETGNKKQVERAKILLASIQGKS